MPPDVHRGIKHHHAQRPRISGWGCHRGCVEPPRSDSHHHEPLLPEWQAGPVQDLHGRQLAIRPPRPSVMDAAPGARISKATGLPVRQYKRAGAAHDPERDWEPGTPPQKVGFIHRPPCCATAILLCWCGVGGLHWAPSHPLHPPPMQFMPGARPMPLQGSACCMSCSCAATAWQAGSGCTSAPPISRAESRGSLTAQLSSLSCDAPAAAQTPGRAAGRPMITSRGCWSCSLTSGCWGPRTSMHRLTRCAPGSQAALKAGRRGKGQPS